MLKICRILNKYSKKNTVKAFTQSVDSNIILVRACFYHNLRPTYNDWSFIIRVIYSTARIFLEKAEKNNHQYHIKSYRSNDILSLSFSMGTRFSTFKR